jgi:type VI secretion system protein ImpD
VADVDPADRHPEHRAAAADAGDAVPAPAAEPPVAPAPTAAGVDLAAFLDEESAIEALVALLGPDVLGRLKSKRAILLKLGELIAGIDERIAGQVNEILHHPRYQRLESSWRGLDYLSRTADDEPLVKVKVLDVSWKELARDADRAAEPNQSELFRKIYTQEYDMPGGEPYSVLIGDYDIRPWPSPDHPVNDLDVLEIIAQVGATAFTPFVAGIHPSFFGVDRFAQLDRLRKRDLGRVFQQPEYARWRSFRAMEDARFVGLTLPRILMRLPYEYDVDRDDGFAFRENVAGTDASKYLWGNAAFAFAGVLIRTFSRYHWLAEIRGARPGEQEGGLVTGLPVHCFATDRLGIAPKSSTDLVISEYLDSELADLGFIPLCHLKNTELSAFYSNQSAERPKIYDEPSATINAKISSMLQYTLCVARFAHTLKARAMEKVGALPTTRELQNDLHNWVNRYVSPDANAPPDVKARFPLREAKVEVTEPLDRPGHYDCRIYLSPHYQLDAIAASVTLRTEVTATDQAARP